MQEIRYNILEDPSKFELICIPCSCYQKKDGSIPVQKKEKTLFGEFVEAYPNLPTEMGEGVEKYGNCPKILNSIPNLKTTTKFCTFPTSPTSLRAKNPDNYVYHRLKGKFKPYSLLPGWSILPRCDMVEFAAIKLSEIIHYYKLTKVAIPFEMFTFDREDVDHYNTIKNILTKHVKDGLFMVSKPNEPDRGTVHNTAVQSSVTYED